jgi:hypothetical protein
MKYRHHASVASQHVAEANRNIPAARGLESANHQFRHALGRPHNVRGANGLIGRDHHELRNAMRSRRFHHVQRAENIVLDRLEDVPLHQRDMLVSRCVKHHGRAILDHQFI